jgi:hypothetical protein
MDDQGEHPAIQHTVAFRLHDGVDEAAFLDEARLLGELSGVVDFEVLDQVGPKSSYTHALSMWFANQDAYDAYDGHPDHQRFVAECWLPNVADSLELDYRRAATT